MVKIQEAENQIITSYEVYEKKPNDSDLLLKAVEEHRERTAPRSGCRGRCLSFTGSEGRYCRNACEAHIPTKPAVKNPVIRKTQKSRWFRKGEKWRTGCEGRISVLKRRHGLDRCRYRGQDGMNRWVGFGVIADNLINIGRVLATPA